MFLYDMKNLKNIVKNHLSSEIILIDLIHDSISDFVKITIDSPKNISIRDTSIIAKRIKNDDSILSMFPKGCSIEVGTPGVGAKLRQKFQYKKNIGRKIFVEYKNHSYNIVSDVFRLIDVKSKGIIVGNSKSNSLILFENIITAKVKVTFD